MKLGFTLIELILAIFISSLISIGLYQMINQTQKGIGFITGIIEADTPIMPFYNQLEKDITGMFTPESSKQFYIKQEEEKEKKDSGESEKAKDDKSAADKKINASDSKEKSKESKIDNVFYIDKKDGHLFLSFVTTAAIQPFSKKEPIYNVPFVRRVAYILEKDQNNPKIYRIIYRYSNNNTSLSAIEKADFKPSYEIIGYVKNLSLDFVVFEQKEEESGGSSKKAEAAKAVGIDQWNEAEIWKKYKTLIPAYITIKGTLTDKLGKTEHPFEFQFKVFAYQQYKKEQKSVLEQLDKWAAEKLPQFMSVQQNKPESPKGMS